jgi:hypothetical protein
VPIEDHEDSIRKVWQLFYEGSLRQADILAAQVISRDKETIPYLPVMEILTSKAQYMAMTGRRRMAAPFIAKAINRLPDSPYPQELCLAMLRAEVIARNGSETRKGRDEAGKLVIGLGTGRCGSTSLTQLLMAQKTGCFSHEHPPDLPWNMPPPGLRFHLQRFALLAQLYDPVGDVGHWWLPHMDAVAKFFPDFRAVVLKRDKEATVESFVTVKEGDTKGGVNHWIDHDGSFWNKVPFDRCYPSYPVTDIREALGRYWEDYYERCEKLAERYPGQLRIFDMAALKTAEGQREILEFCGFDDPVVGREFHANVGHYKDGEDLWGNPYLPPPQQAQQQEDPSPEAKKA